MTPDSRSYDVHERIKANKDRGYPYFHDDPDTRCKNPGMCHQNGWCWKG